MSSAYVDALKMLGRRELSESQVRQRLARRGHEDDDIDSAIARLKEERAIDDARVAGAIARTSTSIKRRGRMRVKREIEQAGIAPDIAKRALEETFSDLDEDALIEAALAKRLRGDARIEDEKSFARLFRYLSAQGFAPDRVMRLLASRRAPGARRGAPR